MARDYPMIQTESRNSNYAHRLESKSETLLYEKVKIQLIERNLSGVNVYTRIKVLIRCKYISTLPLISLMMKNGRMYFYNVIRMN
jgi:hypothetical protein